MKRFLRIPVADPIQPTIDEQIEYIEEYVPNMYWSEALVDTLKRYQRAQEELSKSDGSVSVRRTLLILNGENDG